MGTIIIRSIIIFLALFTLPTIKSSFTNGSSNIGCIMSEKQALLIIKQHLVDRSNRLRSWVHDEDCCRWLGVVCDTVTGHVLELHLENPTLDDWASDAGYEAYERSRFGGKINQSLLNLKLLSYLDLSNNDFGGNLIPKFFGSMGSLSYLNLSNAGFGGLIPHQLGNLSNMQYLDLQGCDQEMEMHVENLSWLSGISQLKYLAMSCVNLNKAFDWLHVVNKFHSLKELHFSTCELPPPFPVLNPNFSSLAILNLKRNNLENSSPIMSLLFNIKTLVTLNLRFNELKGPIPVGLRNLTSLRHLNLGTNKLKGNFPELLPSSLEFIDISCNLFEGVVHETHFANLSKLLSFYGGENSLTLEVHPDWISPFQLYSFHIRSWNLNYQFPKWLHSQKILVELDISNTEIPDSIPSWFWNMSSQFSYLNISNNQIHGKLPYIPNFLPYPVAFDFSSNYFSGPLPRVSSNLTFLNLSNNSLSGSMSYFLCNRVNEMMKLRFLDLSENLLDGEIPDCWMKWPNMKFIRLNSNKFTGSIPSSLGSTLRILSLHLQKNRLSGELPVVLKNCSNLVMLDISENEFNGSIPSWLGLNLQNLKVLILRSNKFYGQIPNGLCALGSLQILDLSHNNLSDHLPTCIGNFSAMFFPRTNTSYIGYGYVYDDPYSYFLMEIVLLVMKGNLNEYGRILGLVKSIDLSENNLQGRIPDEITRLQGLNSLNLSHNHLIGRIPQGVGAMTSLESLDFSANQLSGSIPQSMSNLTFLSHLNLSNNNLIGRIPSSTQLQSFDASSFIGNRLCGPPVTKNCSEIPSARNEGKNDGNGIQVDWFYVMMAIGFAAGFGAILVPLMLSRWWRCQYFQFLDQMWTRLVLLYAKATRFHAS